MAVLNTPDQNTPTGKIELTITDKRTLVMARDVMATVLDAMSQARKYEMRSSARTYQRKNKVVVIGFAIPGHDVEFDNETFLVDGRAITDADAWVDLRDVMA